MFKCQMFKFSNVKCSNVNKVRVCPRAGKSKSLIRWKRLKGGKRRKKAEKGGKGEFDLQLDFWQNSTSLVEMS